MTGVPRLVTKTSCPARTRSIQDPNWMRHASAPTLIGAGTVFSEWS
jgi:hypothetical protein